MRALLLVIDHLAVGNTAEGAGTPDSGSLGQLFHNAPDLELPTLFSLGLGEIIKGRVFDPPAQHCAASYGRMIQRSAGADSLSGLWELAGVIPTCPFIAAQQARQEITAALASSGTEFLLNPTGDAPLLNEPGALDALRKEHLRTGSPILTFSADSTLHIAAHESTLPPTRLARLCRLAREQCDAWRIARVTGQLLAGKPGAWKPACEALTFSMVPPRTILNAISDKGLPVVAVGTVNEAFARSGITRAYPSASFAESMRTVERLWNSPQNGIICVDSGNLANAGMAEFARAQESFDAWLAGFLEQIESDDLLIITGSNGSDPAMLAPDFPRQEVPVLVRYGGRNAPLGVRETFADVAATLGAFFGIDERPLMGEPLITFHRPRGFGP